MIPFSSKDIMRPDVIAYDLGYPQYIIDAIRKAKSSKEAEKILIDARNGNFERYKNYNSSNET